MSSVITNSGQVNFTSAMTARLQRVRNAITGVDREYGELDNEELYRTHLMIQTLLGEIEWEPFLSAMEALIVDVVPDGALYMEVPMTLLQSEYVVTHNAGRIVTVVVVDLQGRDIMVAVTHSPDQNEITVRTHVPTEGTITLS